MTLPAPVAARAADPAVEHLAAVELHARRSAAPPGRPASGRLRLARSSCTTLNDTGTTVPGSSGSGASAIRIRNSRSARRSHDLARGLLARELAEVFLDVLDFERAALEGVLLDQVFQSISVEAVAAVDDAAAAVHCRPGAARGRNGVWRVPVAPAPAGAAAVGQGADVRAASLPQQPPAIVDAGRRRRVGRDGLGEVAEAERVAAAAPEHAALGAHERPARVSAVDGAAATASPPGPAPQFDARRRPPCAGSIAVEPRRRWLTRRRGRHAPFARASTSSDTIDAGDAPGRQRAISTRAAQPLAAADDHQVERRQQMADAARPGGPAAAAERSGAESAPRVELARAGSAQPVRAAATASARGVRWTTAAAAMRGEQPPHSGARAPASLGARRVRETIAGAVALLATSPASVQRREMTRRRCDRRDGDGWPVSSADA